MDYLEIRAVSVQFEQGFRPVKVLEDVSFVADPREFLCIVGPSGCGKSTLLHVIAGLSPAFPPQAGEVLVDGRRVRGPGRDRVMVFQEYAIYPWLTVEANMQYGLKIGRVPPDERQARVDRYLDLLSLQDFRAAYPHQLSGGMKQRVALGRALVMNPNILLMDEPFAAVDAITRRELQEELLRIWELEHSTILFVTHNIEEALFLGNRVIVLSARPARILMDKPVEISRPRLLAEIHRNPNFVQLEHEITQHLRMGSVS